MKYVTYISQGIHFDYLDPETDQWMAARLDDVINITLHQVHYRQFSWIRYLPIKWIPTFPDEAGGRLSRANPNLESAAIEPATSWFVIIPNDLSKN